MTLFDGHNVYSPFTLEVGPGNDPHEPEDKPGCPDCVAKKGHCAYLDADGYLYCLLRHCYIAPQACPYRKEGLP